MEEKTPRIMRWLDVRIVIGRFITGPDCFAGDTSSADYLGSQKPRLTGRADEFFRLGYAFFSRARRGR